jgi:c-di-GMP-binding flagellar brake protein YcgR
VPLDATVLDISGGGLGLQIANDFASHLDTGAVFRDCRINLPEEGLLSTSLCVRNVFNVETKTGHHYLRVGCEYLDLPGTRLTMIQRYITRAERERKARAAGE